MITNRCLYAHQVATRKPTMSQLNHDFSSLSDICLKFIGTLGLCETGIGWQTQIKIRRKSEKASGHQLMYRSNHSLANVSQFAWCSWRLQHSGFSKDWDLEWELELTGPKCRSQRHLQNVSRTGSTLNTLLATNVTPCSASQRATIIGSDKVIPKPKAFPPI